MTNLRWGLAIELAWSWARLAMLPLGWLVMAGWPLPAAVWSGCQAGCLDIAVHNGQAARRWLAMPVYAWLRQLWLFVGVNANGNGFSPPVVIKLGHWLAEDEPRYIYDIR